MPILIELLQVIATNGKKPEQVKIDWSIICD